MITSLSIIIKTEDDLPSLCNALAEHIKPGTPILLSGDLGSGKTTFTRTLAQNFAPQTQVNSPSYAIVQEYPCHHHIIKKMVHIDLYRITNIDEIYHLSLDNYINENTLCIIEWAEKLEDINLDPHIKIEIQVRDDDSREFKLQIRHDQDYSILLETLASLF